MRKLKIEEMQRLDVEQFRSEEKVPLTLVLDNVRSLNNVGSLFRTADAFRLEGLILCGITGLHPHPMIHKTALGAELSVAWEHAESTLEAVERLRSKGYKIWALEQATDSLCPEESPLTPPERVALVVGNEVHGVADDVIACVDRCIEIPQYGTKHSLNVSVSAGIAIYSIVAEYLRTMPNPE